MIVHPMQPLGHQCDKALPQAGVLYTEMNDLTLRIRGEDDIVDGFRRQTMSGQFHETEKVPREKELHDLAPAIGQMFAQANGATQHFIGMLRGVTFVENRLIVVEAQFGSDVLQSDKIPVCPGCSGEDALRIAGSWTD